MKSKIKLRVIVTQSCNLFCKCCFNEWQTARKANFATPDVLVENICNIGNKISSIKLTGGEPLLHADIGSIAHKLSHVAPVSITTNGLLLKKRIAEIPTEIPITISAYGIDANCYVNYTQTNERVFPRFIEQLSVVKEEVNRLFSLNVIIGDSQSWQHLDFIEFAVKYGFKKIRFLTQLNKKYANKYYKSNEASLLRFMDGLSVYTLEDGDPSLIFANTEEIAIELVRQYSEFDYATQERYGFLWMDYKGNTYNAINNDVFNAKGFLNAKHV